MSIPYQPAAAAFVFHDIGECLLIKFVVFVQLREKYWSV